MLQRQDPEWVIWPVSWSAVWVGALTALAIGLLIGLVGLALGANEAAQYVDWKKVHLIGLIFSVGGAFFGYVAGGWAAARIAGRVRSEPAILHGAIVWLVTIPMLLLLGAVGAAGHVGRLVRRPLGRRRRRHAAVRRGHGGRRPQQRAGDRGGTPDRPDRRGAGRLDGLRASR